VAALAAGILCATAHGVEALEVRIEQARALPARVTASVELRDLLRNGFLDTLQQGGAIFVQLQAELWEDRRIGDRLALTTAALTYRIDAGGAGLVVVGQFGERTAHGDLRVPVALRVDVGPAAVVADERTYYLRARVTAATVEERDIEQFGTAIFGDPQSAAGLAGLGRFVFTTLLRIGRYLESASAEATSARYRGREIKSGI
jgi:hypothetical protein